MLVRALARQSAPLRTIGRPAYSVIWLSAVESSLFLHRRSYSTHMAPTAHKPWFVDAFGGTMSAEYQRYMSEEWGFEKRGDQPLFEKLCLEGAQAGLSWATILAKRENYRAVFHGFDIKRCAAMTESEIDDIVNGDGGVIRHRGKIQSVVNNACRVMDLIAELGENDEEPQYGWFDHYLWSFVDHRPVLNEWTSLKDMPAETSASIRMATALKKRGFKFVGSKICYSLMQSCGLVVDHLKGTPEWHAAKLRLENRQTLISNMPSPVHPITDQKPASRKDVLEPQDHAEKPSKRPRRRCRRGE